MSGKLPNNLQAVLWSHNIDKIDLNINKKYIINQILAYGTWDNLKWLFKNYKLSDIREVFVNNPEKDYTPQGYNFTKNVLLNVDKSLDIQKYVKTYPRNIRQ